MNEILYRLCRHNVNIMDGYIPFPSTCLSRLCNTSLYKTRKELKKLKEQGLVVSDRYCEIGEDRNILVNGYTITEKAKETEEYKKAFQEEAAICKECFGINFKRGEAQ